MGFLDNVNVTRRQVVIGLALVALFLVLLFAWQAFTASRALVEARQEADRVQELIRAGDFDGASRALDDLAASAARAHDKTDGFVWDIGKHVPYFGRNVGAVQTVSEVLDTATSVNAPVALRLSQAVKAGTFKPVDGRIDLPQIEKLTPDVQRAADSIESAGKKLDEIRSSSLLFPFNDMVGELQEQFDDARSASTATATAFRLMPEMLGKTTPRNYLLMIQNPAELRATGGLAGSLAILHAEGGRVEMREQTSATPFKFPAPVVEQHEDTERMYGLTPAMDFRDLNFSPDFPEAAQIARVMVKRKLGVDVDGVVSVDPLALAAVLAATPQGVQVDGKQITAATVVPTLLNQIYRERKTDPVGQDDFFERAAKTIFNVVMSGAGNQQTLIRGLGEATSQHRILLWSRHAEEQSQLAGTAISGALSRDTGRTPEIGMYLNDSTAGKMDYFLQYRTAVTAVECVQDDAQDIRATISVKSTMPKNFASQGISVLGSGEFAPQGDIAFNLRLYAPYGGQVTGLRVDGEEASVTADKHFGRQVAFLPVLLKPGQEKVITADLQTRAGQDGDGYFSFTPGMLPAPNGVKFTSACG